jgi:hypothetical protein
MLTVSYYFCCFLSSLIRLLFHRNTEQPWTSWPNLRTFLGEIHEKIQINHRPGCPRRPCRHVHPAYRRFFRLRAGGGQRAGRSTCRNREAGAATKYGGKFLPIGLARPRGEGFDATGAATDWARAHRVVAFRGKEGAPLTGSVSNRMRSELILKIADWVNYKRGTLLKHASACIIMLYP